MGGSRGTVGKGRPTMRSHCIGRGGGPPLGPKAAVNRPPRPHGQCGARGPGRSGGAHSRLIRASLRAKSRSCLVRPILSCCDAFRSANPEPFKHAADSRGTVADGVRHIRSSRLPGRNREITPFEPAIEDILVVFMRCRDRAVGDRARPWCYPVSIDPPPTCRLAGLLAVGRRSFVSCDRWRESCVHWFGHPVCVLRCAVICQ